MPERKKQKAKPDVNEYKKYTPAPSSFSGSRLTEKQKKNLPLGLQTAILAKRKAMAKAKPKEKAKPSPKDSESRLTEKQKKNLPLGLQAHILAKLKKVN